MTSDFQLLPDYLKPNYKIKRTSLDKNTYDQYLNDMYLLDERSEFTYIWNELTNTYKKVLWTTLWKERRESILEKREAMAEECFAKIEKQMLENEERNKLI